MKIFLDTANRELIQKWVQTGLVDGVTTNPSLLSKEGRNSKEVLLDICSIVPGDVSIEVIEKTPDAVYKQALEISKLAPNVAVKIPFAQEYLPVIAQLAKEGVKLNITLIFSPLQALAVAKLGVTYISPFIGRLDDIGVNGLEIVDEILTIKDNYGFTSEIIAASIRSMIHWKETALSGVDIATVPPQLMDQLMIHPLTEKGIEIFDRDWKKLGKENLLD
ncbi:MAG: transaldolase family protein [bacterium]